MTLNKVVYSEKKTLISAQNLNDIQDAIIDLEKKAPPLFVAITTTSTIASNGNRICNVSHAYSQIDNERTAGRDVYGVVNKKVVIPLVRMDSVAAVFQGPSGTGTDWQVHVGNGWGNEAQMAIIEYATKTDLDSYAKSEELKPPLYVTLNNPNGTQWVADNTQAQIKAARDAGRNVMCVLDYQGKNIVPLINTLGSSATFQGPIYVYAERKIVDATVVITKGSDGIAQVTMSERAFKADLAPYAKTSDLANYALARNVTDESFFDIDADGVISLKAEYKGSKMADLPEVVIIPQNIDGEEVSGFEEGMFSGNTRVKEIVIPSTVKVLPDHFAKEAIHLEKLTNTEQLEAIGAGALQQTRISELVCPNLKALSSEACWQAYCLQYADLGKITGIPENAFKHCENLQEVKADHVTSIGKHSFYGTRRLKSLSCLPNVKSIGDGAFWSSRCDLEALPADCAFGNLSSYKQFNPTEYWKGVSFTPCKVPLGSLFSQYDPRWADEEIKYTAADGTEYAYLDDNGNPCTYAENGCALFTLMAIYSAFTGTTFNDPKAFFPVLENARMLGKDFRKHSTWIEIANGLDFETEPVTVVTSESCQKIYDALQGGALLYRSTVGGIPSDDFINAGIATNVLAQGTHAMLGYGINSDGEMLTSDTAMHGHKVGVYENHKTAWHIYKHGSELCDCVIVRKPK